MCFSEEIFGVSVHKKVISQLTDLTRHITIGRKVHCIRKCEDKKNETEAKVMKRAKPQVIRTVRVGFMSLWMTFSSLKFKLL